MNPILQPVDDLLNQKDQAIALLQHRIDLAIATSVYDGLECSPWLVAQGTAANTGSTGSTMAASQAQPSITSAWLGIVPNGPWADAYFYKKLGTDSAKATFVYDLAFLFGTANDSAASNCIELDIQQVIAGQVLNMGWQFDFGENLLRVWNRSSQQWIATGHPCPRWPAGQWMHVITEQHRDNFAVYHDALTLNGVRLSIGINFPIRNLALPDMLNCAVQLDGNKAGTPYKVYLDRVKFTAS